MSLIDTLTRVETQDPDGKRRLTLSGRHGMVEALYTVDTPVRHVALVVLHYPRWIWGRALWISASPCKECGDCWPKVTTIEQTDPPVDADYFAPLEEVYLTSCVPVRERTVASHGTCRQTRARIREYATAC